MKTNPIYNTTTSTITKSSPISQGQGERRTENTLPPKADILNNYDMIYVDTSQDMQITEDEKEHLIFFLLLLLNHKSSILLQLRYLSDTNLLADFLGTISDQLGKTIESLKDQSNILRSDILLRLAKVFNHPYLAKIIMLETETEKQIHYCNLLLKILASFSIHTTDPTTICLHTHLGHIYLNDPNLKDVKQGVQHLDTTVEIQKRLSPGNNEDTADFLFDLGKTYRDLSDNLNSLQYFEASLKMWLLILPTNCPKLSNAFNELGNVYSDLKDPNKASACFKKARILTLNSYARNDEKFISSYGEIDLNLTRLKQKIRAPLLDKIVNAINKGYGWSYIGYTSYDWGVKGYIDQNYVKTLLTSVGETEEHIKPALMLCFESMNLAIWQSSTYMTKCYGTVKEFTKANPDLVKEIAREHPEFFVDHTIITACKEAMNDTSFAYAISRCIHYKHLK